MKPTIHLETLERQIDFEAISRNLAALEHNDRRNRKTIATLLERLKPALVDARARNVSFSELTSFLKASGIPVSEPTLRHYLQGFIRKKKRRPKKGKHATKAVQFVQTQSTPSIPESQTRKLPPRLTRQKS